MKLCDPILVQPPAVAAAVDDGQFANVARIADAEIARPALIAHVLRSTAQLGAAADAASRANGGAGLDKDVRADHGIGADGDARLNDAEGANGDVVRQVGARVDNRPRINPHYWASSSVSGLSPRKTSNWACAASSPSTHA